MRIDLFLKATGLYKTRAEAKRALLDSRVTIGADAVKPSREVQVGDTFLLKRLEGLHAAKVLQVPRNASVSRKDRSLYVRVDPVCDDQIG